MTKGFKNFEMVLMEHMKTVYILHGWGFDSNMPWIKWLEAELKEKGFEVHAFDMPNTKEPKIEDWVGYLEENIKNIDEKTFFVGHSIGCQTIMRFLEKSSKDKHTLHQTWMIQKNKSFFYMAKIIKSDKNT